MLTVKFLEDLGRNPAISEAEYQASIKTFGLTDAEATCLTGRDATKLAALLGGRAQMWCAIMAPDDAPADLPAEPSHEEPEPDQEAS